MTYGRGREGTSNKSASEELSTLGVCDFWSPWLCV